jgi:hypothetical protein
MEEAQTVLRMSTEWATEFSRTAEKLLTIPMNPVKLDKVISNAFPKKTQETQRQEENREQVWAVVRDIYRNSNNAGGYGENGWSMLNAIGEYLDHYRDADTLDRANASMNMYSWVSKTKVQSEKFILSLV